MSTKFKILAVLTTLLLALDQITKVWVVRALAYSGPPLPRATSFSLQSAADGLASLGHNAGNKEEILLVDGFLSFIHTQNPNAAMGLGNNFEYKLPLFYAFTGVAMFVLYGMYRQLPKADRIQSATIAFILSGALGNFIDRLHKGTVTDFVRVYTDNPSWKSWLIQNLGTAEYPTWNVADAAIVVGVAMYVLHQLFARDKEIENAGDNPLDADDKAGAPS